MNLCSDPKCYAPECQAEQAKGRENVWIPEAPNYSGLYAILTRGVGGNCTYDVHRALQFVSKEACTEWCEKNPYPVFRPVEHGFPGRTAKGDGYRVVE